MNDHKKRKSITKSNFKTEVEGKKIRLYRLKNTKGVEMTITNFGQKIVSLLVPDRNGTFGDIVLGFSTIQEYLNTDEIYFGSIIGRYSNRIAEGKIMIDGISYFLSKNNNGNHLHGGKNGFHNVVWDTEVISENEIQFTRVSSDSEEGYPGNLMVRVHYELTNQNELKINYYAITDKTTIVNMTHHSYFNLAGAGNGSINDHLLMINADQFTPVNNELIPTGELASVKNTPFDFTKIKPIGNELMVYNEQLNFGKGYDHNFVLLDTPKNEEGLKLAAKVSDPKSGRTMEVYTSQPGIHFYGGNFLNGKTIGKNDQIYLHRGGFCLETQGFPDSPNQPNFPSTELKPGETYRSTSVYKFSV